MREGVVECTAQQFVLGTRVCTKLGVSRLA